MEEIDPNFEPQSRPRSSTWPLRRPDFLDNKPEASPAIAEEEPQPNVEQQSLSQHCHEPPPAELTALTPEPIVPEVLESLVGLGDNKPDSSTPNKKNTSRRNAWGNLSYADLITKAVQSSPEQRLTLSQIYEWMVKNVPYFKDKGDSNSSAGWKNSIRHNLSLHSRFVRVQNEGTGKSSWWMINPDAKPGKSSRRRASSMDTKNSNWEKKRGRAKKKVEAERAAKWPNSPNSTADVDFPLDSPFDQFRSRASSNASSCGRLSPILANSELDLHDHDGPPLSPATSLGPPPPSYESAIGSELAQVTELTESMAESMNLSTSINSSLNSDQMNSSVEQMHLRQSNGLYHSQNGGNNYIFSPPGSGYNSSQPSPSHSGTGQSPFSHYSCTSQTSALSPQQMAQQQQRTPSMTNLSEQFPMMHQPRINFNASLTQSEAMLTQTNPIMSSNNALVSHNMLQDQMPPSVVISQRNQMMPSCRNQSLNLARNISMSQGSGNASQLSALLTMPGPYNSRYQVSGLQQQIHPPNGMPLLTAPQYNNHNNEAMQHDRFPQDLDLDMFQDGLQCDMDSIIRTELDIGDGFDFNFDQPSAINVPPAIQQSMPMMQANTNGNVTRNWVH